MQMLNKPNLREVGEIRPCTKRLKKLESSRSENLLNFKNSNQTTNSSKSTKTILRYNEDLDENMDKMFKGPLKKRPVNDGASSGSNGVFSNLTPNVRNKVKPAAPKPKVKSEVFETPPPTIAASRSRRSIKPNPRYASEDMVTPKMIRTGTATPILRRSETPVMKSLDSSQSDFIENFFNKDTDEDDEEDEIIDRKTEESDQPFVIEDSEPSDGDEGMQYEAPQKKRRGRPRKSYLNSSLTSQTEAPRNTINIISKQQSESLPLRKSLVTNNVVHQSSPNLSNLKRKIEDNSETSEQISRKKILLTQGLKVLKSDKMSTLDTKMNSIRKPLTPARQEISKSSDAIPPSENDSFEELTPQERRRQILAKSLPKGISIKPAGSPKVNITPKTLNQSMSTNQTISTKASSIITSLNMNKIQRAQEENSDMKYNSTQKQNKSPLQKTVVSRMISTVKRRSASPVSRSPSTLSSSPKQSDETSSTPTNDDPFNSVNPSTDDTEMPTFTIVNIHDIIKKKGDPLISHKSPTPQRDSPSPTLFNNNNNNTNISNNNNNNGENEDEDDEENSLDSSPGHHVNEKKLVLKTEKQPLIGRRKPGPASSKILVEKKEETPIVKRKVGRPKNSEKKPTPKGPTILNHTLNKARGGRSPSIVPVISTSKPAPRILNSVVAKKTEPVKPVIANLDDSADESIQLSLDEREETEDDSDFEIQSKTIPKSRKISTPKSKENSSALTNCQNTDTKKVVPPPKTPTEKTVIQRDGDKIIKKVTCFETWYVLNIEEEKATIPPRNQLDIPLVELANQTHDLNLPSEQWTSKVTLYELAPSVDTSNLTMYTGDLSESSIQEEDRGKYQPSCVMFRRSSMDLTKRLPYDRAVIFKNKTFFTNMDGKNVKLLGAPHSVNCFEDVEVLLQLLNDLNLDSPFIEQITTTQ